MKTHRTEGAAHIDNDCLDLDRQVVLGQDGLVRQLDDLDLHVDRVHPLRERVDLDQPGVDSAVELSEARDESDVALADGLGSEKVRGGLVARRRRTRTL